METYDYRDSKNIIERLLILAETLSQHEAEETIETIKTLKLTKQNTMQENHARRFESAIEPALKEFAEMTSSLLTIEKPATTYIIATLTNSYGFNITHSCKMIRDCLILANEIGIDSTDEVTALTLIYDYS